MGFKKWDIHKLEEIIQFNPRETIKKGTIAKKIALEKITPFSKKIRGFEVIEYKSGTKFRNGDTLVARITPSLENGKTAQVDILDEGEVGFGSTEFIVLRAKQGETNNDFIYYLATSDKFREIAIKSMTGTSGRQRVQNDVLKKSDFEIPLIKEQKAIANILSTLDEKIEVNNQINKTLEDMAQAIFKQWFVEFEFPNENGKPYKSSGGKMIESELGMIPEGWEVVDLRKLFKFIKGKKPKVIEDYKFENSEKYLTIDVLNRNSILFCTKEKTVEVNDNEVLMVMDGASSGAIYFGQKGIVASTLAKLDLINSRVSNQFLFYLVKFFEKDIKANNTGSAIPHTDKEFTYRIKIALPEDMAIQKKANKTFCDISDTYIIRDQESAILKVTRDTLLPKLMSGEIRVPLDKEGEVS